MFFFCPHDLAAGMHTCNLGIVQWLNGSTIHKLREYKYGCFSILAACVVMNGKSVFFSKQKGANKLDCGLRW